MEERRKEGKRNPLKIEPFIFGQFKPLKIEPFIFRQFKPRQDNVAVEAFFEGIEDRIRKWCPKFLPFYERKRKTLLDFVAADWQSNVMEAHWTNSGDCE